VGANLAQAMLDYRHALSLNPRIGQAWADLADCYDQMGNYAEAEKAFLNAFIVHRYSPSIRWQAGNFYLRRGNLSKMYECFKMSCEYDPQKLAIAMDVSWKIDSEHEQILQKLIPDTLTANLSYLEFLVSRNELTLAAPVWQRFMKSIVPETVELKPACSFSYIDRLISHNHVDEALKVWIDILRKTHSDIEEGHRLLTDIPENLIWNGSFENEFLNGGFDWRNPERSAVKLSIDTTNRMQGLKSLKATFQSENFSYAFLSQIVPVPEAGSYQLDFCLRAEGLTTDQLPYLALQSYPETTGIYATSSNVPSATEWRKVTIPFTVKPGCNAILLQFQRNQSAKFDNALKGTLWLDGFSLRKVGE
jgi:tetratricopeptide (TPR) repeat protein